MRSAQMKRAVGILLVAAALGMLSYRLIHVELAAFTRDEPQFLNAAREQLQTGVWVSASPLYGNMGLRYGPTAFWFYGIVQFFFGDDPKVAIEAMGLMITIAHLALAIALTHLFSEGIVFLAVLLAWIASSPYQFFWSRLAWDLTSHAAVVWAVVVLCLYKELHPGRTVALGLLLGLALSTHPMVVPFLLAVGLALAWELRRQQRDLMRLGGLLAAVIVAVNLPYIIFLLSSSVVQRAPRHPLSLGAVVSLFLEAPRVATTWRLEYLFGPDWADFQNWLGAAARPCWVVSAVALAACTVGAATGLATTLWASDVRQRRMGRMAVLSWAGSVFLLAGLGLEQHPHYQCSAAWAAVFGMAGCLAWLRRRSRRWGAAALIVLGTLALAQFFVIVRWMGYVSARGGTRGGPYASSIGTQIGAMRLVCSGPESLIVLRNDTAMFPFSFEYLASTENTCRGKTVIVCAPVSGPLTKACPPLEVKARLRHLSYAHETGGALRVD
jgi:hypothetical protein